MGLDVSPEDVKRIARGVVGLADDLQQVAASFVLSRGQGFETDVAIVDVENTVREVMSQLAGQTCALGEALMDSGQSIVAMEDAGSEASGAFFRGVGSA